ncbi:glutamate 5-kinase [Neocallimastix californiae]|uniref:Glutamate 5-kinase n=1 Tax=Neocallimastix californiae TaxID=1754190 RepID=A0A1Y2EWL4_9FUNG|nr:glutamate 5-kinase [Neocallimastix californiae]|eukprot:ORY75897.1 glutamate 5-kinase [Neocallimastix californiae]
MATENAPNKVDENINRSTKYKKGTYTIIIKIGTSSICDEHNYFPKLANLSMLVESIIELKKLGHRPVLVSSGAVGTGLRRLNFKQKPTKSRAKVQAIAAVGQGRLMSKYDTLFSNFNQPIAQVLLSRSDLTERFQYINACNTFNELLNMGVIPIVNENDTICNEHSRYGDNDTLSGITAGITNADFLFLLTDVDALYTDNPRINPEAKPIHVVKDLEELHVSISTPGSAIGTGGMSTKLVAADIASNAGCTTVIMNGKYPNNIVDIIKEASERESTNKEINPKIGTHFLPNDVLLNDREWWIRFGLAPLGQIQIKPECIKHLIEQKLKHRESSEKLDSIYPIDVEDTQDYFFPNQCISLTTIIKNNDTGKDEIVEVGRALSNYTSSEIQLIKGHDSCDIIKILGETGPKIRKSIVSKENIALSLNKRLLQLFDLF